MGGRRGDQVGALPHSERTMHARVELSPSSSWRPRFRLWRNRETVVVAIRAARWHAVRAL